MTASRNRSKFRDEDGLFRQRAECGVSRLVLWKAGSKQLGDWFICVPI
jgi:hypothetical protein